MLCLTNRKGRTALRGHRYCVRPITRIVPWWSIKMKKPDVSKGKPGASGGGIKETDRELFKNLLSYWMDSKWDDGSVRETSTVSLFVEEGMFKAALNDRDLRRSAYVSGDSIEDVLLKLELGLEGDTLDWRSWQGGKGKGKK